MSKKIEAAKSMELLLDDFHVIVDKQQASFERAIDGTYEAVQGASLVFKDDATVAQRAAIDMGFVDLTSESIQMNETKRVLENLSLL